MTSTASMPAVAVVSVTHNRVEPLLVLLRQVAELDYEAACLDVFLVDNASTDDTMARVRAEFPHVHLVQSENNTGVSAGFNLSIQAGLGAGREYKYLWLLDSDAEVEPQTLRGMVDAMEADDTLGVVGSAVYDPVERSHLVTAGLRIDWQEGDIPLLVPDQNNRNALLDVDLVPACSMLTRASLYARIGYWDTRFPLYWGDTDWCARVLRAGNRVCCDASSRVWHRDWSHVRRGFGATVFIRDHIRGGLLFYLRHDPQGSLRGTRRLMLKTYLRAALECLTLRQGYRQAYLGAVDDVLAGRFERRITQPQGEPALQSLERLATELSRVTERRHRPRILLNQLTDETQKQRIKTAMARHFDAIEWLEIAPDKVEEWAEYRAFKPVQLLRHVGRVLAGMRDIDISICSVSRPLMYNAMSGRHVLLLDSADDGVIERNSLWASLAKATSIGLYGLKATYADLPRALRVCAGLNEAIAGGDVQK